MSCPAPTHRKHAPAFTLLEMLLALAITGGLLASLFTSLSVVFGMRKQAETQLQRRLALRVALDHLAQDLLAAPQPLFSSVMAGQWQGEPGQGPTGERADRLEWVTSRRGLAPAGGMEDRRGDRIQVVYQVVADPHEPDARYGGMLVREVTDNLLAPVEPEPVRQIIARGVLGFELAYEDQEEWTDTWDPLVRGLARPRAVRVRLTVRAEEAPEEERRAAGRSAVEREMPVLTMERLVLLPTQMGRLEGGLTGRLEGGVSGGLPAGGRP